MRLRRGHDAIDRLAGRFGIKYIFLISVIGFTLASAPRGAATSLGRLVFFAPFRGWLALGWSLYLRPPCCRSIRRSVTGMPWRCSASVPSGAFW